VLYTCVGVIITAYLSLRFSDTHYRVCMVLMLCPGADRGGESPLGPRKVVTLACRSPCVVCHVEGVQESLAVAP
jgi:hypothetical protein